MLWSSVSSGHFWQMNEGTFIVRRNAATHKPCPTAFSIDQQVREPRHAPAAQVWEYHCFGPDISGKWKSGSWNKVT